MALQDIVNVSIGLETSGVSRAGFGIPIFIGAHRWTNERVKAYSSLTAAAVDLPANSKEYKAVEKFFSQTPRPTVVKVGRREASTVITPAAPAEGDVFTITVYDALGNSVVATITAGTSPDQEDIVDGLKADIDGSTPISAAVTATKSGTGAAAILTLTPVSGKTFKVSGATSNLVVTHSTTETAADVMSAITAVDNDFYFVAAHDHTETFVLAMASNVEAREKVYFVSTAETGSLSALATPATDIIGKLKELGYFRTVTMWHQSANTDYPECAFVGRGAPFVPGTITWANKIIAGVAPAAHPTTGLKLSATELDALSARNCNFIVAIGNNNIVREGKVSGGEWIDVIRSRDLLQARITEAFQSKLINSAKIPYTDNGINAMRSVLESTLNRYVSTEATPNILQENTPFVTVFPKAADISFEDKASRVLSASFEAYLAGAIHATVINGVLTLDAE